MSAPRYWFEKAQERARSISILDSSQFEQRDLPIVITILFGILFLWLFVALYLGSTVIGTARTPDITVTKIIETFTQPNILRVTYNTLVLGFGAGFIATILGTYYAWVIVRTNAPGRRLLRMLAIIPMAIPLLTNAIGWIAMFSPQIGEINQFFRNAFGIETIFNLYSLHGIVIVTGVGAIGLSFLLMEPAIRSLPSSHEEAAKASGASVPTIFTRITMPLLLPAMASSFLLVSIYAFGNFEYPFFFGQPADVNTFATEIYDAMRGGILPSYDIATILSMFYTASALIMIFGYQYITRGGFKFQIVSGRTERSTHLNLGRWRWVASLSCLFIVFIAFGIPIIGILGLAFAYNASELFTQFSLMNFHEFLGLSGLVQVVKTTLILSTTSAIGVVVFSLFLSYTAVKLDVRFITKAADYISALPLGLPPIVYGVAVFWFVMLTPGTKGLYGTIWPLVIAVIFLKIPHGVRMISSSLIQISDELEEAARASGASWFTSARHVTVPLLKDGIANAFLFTFIDSAKELAAIVLLVTAGNQVLMGMLMLIWTQNPSALPMIAAGSIMFTIVLAVLSLVQSKITT